MWLVGAYAAAVGWMLNGLNQVRAFHATPGLAIWFGVLAIALWSRTEGIFRDIGYAVGSDRAGLAWLVLFAALLSGSCIFVYRRSRLAPRSFVALSILLLLALVLCAASSQKGGAGPMVEYFMRQFGMDQPTAEAWVIGVRKTIHFGYYGCLGVAAWTSAMAGSVSNAIPWAVGFSAICACFDELRQATQPGRTGSAWDVLLDLAGASVCIGIGSLIVRRIRNRSQGTT